MLNLPSRADLAELIEQLDVLIEKADDAQWREFRRVLVAAGYVKPNVTLREIKRLAEKLDELLAVEGKRVLDIVEEGEDIAEITRKLLPATMRLDDPLIIGAAQVVRETMVRIIPLLTGAYVARIDNQLVVDAITQRTTDFIDSWSRELAVRMKLDTDKAIHRLIRTALEKGESVQQLALRIQKSGIRDPYWRARRVAITELLRAHSYAAQEAMLQNPAVESKRWRHSGSRFNHPRENHVAMDGVTVPKNQPFDLTGANGKPYSPMVPRDTSLPASESVNCHCVVQPVVEERVLELTLEERQRLRDEAMERDNRAWEAQANAEKHVLADMLRGEAVDRDALKQALQRKHEDGDVWRM